MKHTLLFLLVILFSCSKNSKIDTKFSQTDIENLSLDSTKEIHIQTDEVVKIDISPFLTDKTIDSGDLINAMQLLPLETTDDCLISEIEKILLTDNHIYILDNYKRNSVVIFTKEGKFVKRIETGPGPEEINDAKDIGFDKDANELIVFNSIFFSFFTADGKFIKKVKPLLNALSFRVIPDGYLFYATQNAANEHLGVYKTNQIFITNKDFELISCGIPYRLAKNNTFTGDDYLRVHRTSIYFSPKFLDTIYQYINAGTFKAKYVLDFGKKKIPEDVLTGDFDLLWKSLKQNDYHYFMGEYIENDSHEFFGIDNHYNKKRFKTLIFKDKHSGNLIGGNQVNLDEYFVFNLPLTSTDSRFVSYFNPAKIPLNYEKTEWYKKMPDDNKQIIRELKEDDNPVLLFYELKDF